MPQESRRQFIKGSLALSAGFALSPISHLTASEMAPTTQTNSRGFFTLGKRKDRWFLITPGGEPFFSTGLNHIDPASLRYPENICIWRDTYGGSTLRWIKESVAPNLKEWGFNTVGWVQEVSVRQWRHSRAFTVDEYRALDMPYCHSLPFTESHQWEKHTVHYDFRSKDWQDWCEYVARDQCAELADDPNLIGYFYSDCPTWVHNLPENEWRGPIFDPEMLKTEAGKKELTEIATAYYKTIHDTIRRYDKHHLLLGDRYENYQPISMEVVNAALPYVDVLSFQDFNNPIKNLDDWHKKTGKPVLLADSAKIKWHTEPGEFTPNDGTWYADTLEALFQNPGCIGFHLCGAYQRNKARRYGLLDELENPDTEQVDPMKAANLKIAQQIESQF
ncbi:twin-arginine translocation signal domain-containing protein [Pelagicoccus mobilis]|uniref:Agarase n=1 Tax=Pelagicoccus mobilis TaxID=415221 RepID=A0A934VP68_9BACT|nr:twin-arginine translocation signal domain-containing protein [Pelagicoccus mobilis]MBK1875228.1 hypothetical protein [Pelagicoccus mobilis]